MAETVRRIVQGSVKATPSSSEAHTSRWRQPNILLIVCVAIAAWLVLVPVAALLVTAFTEDTGLGFGAFTLDNFVEAYASTRILRLFANSVVYALGTAVVTFLIGGFVAWAVERTDAPGRTLFHNLALLSFAVPGLLDRKSTRLNSSHLVISY